MQIDVSDVMICDAFTVVPSIVNDKKKKHCSIKQELKL